MTECILVWWIYQLIITKKMPSFGRSYFKTWISSTAVTHNFIRLTPNSRHSDVLNCIEGYSRSEIHSYCITIKTNKQKSYLLMSVRDFYVGIGCCFSTTNYIQKDKFSFMWKNLFWFKLNKTVSNNDLDLKLFEASHIVWFELVLWKLCVVNSRKTIIWSEMTKAQLLLPKIMVRNQITNKF